MTGRRLRVATWNLERPSARSWKKAPAQREQMHAIDADVWALTETRVGLEPADGYRGLDCPPHPARRPLDETWTAVWTRWRIEPTDLPATPRGSLPALVDTPIGRLVMYGTVLPWHSEPGDEPDRKAKNWEVHAAEVQRQGDEWRRLRELYPDSPLIVAGDFNQDRDGSGWYGTRRVRDLLTEALDGAGLVCVTALDAVAAGLLQNHHLIDHICVSADLLDRFEPTVHCWEPVSDAGVRMSDHPAVAIDLIER